MVGGQAADVSGAPVGSIAELERIHAAHTGALIAAAVGIGGLVGGASAAQLAALAAYGAHVGLGFQLADDVLDAAEAEEEGGPPSFVRFLGVEGTRQRALALGRAAEEAVAGLPQPAALVALARSAVDRAR
jgi:geranylgeranyl pyrophosphate synthase